MTLREKELSRRSPHVRSAEDTPITILPNRKVNIQGYLHNELHYQPVCGMLSPTVISHIPADLDI